MVAAEMEAAFDGGSPIPPDAKKILHDLASSWGDVQDWAMTNEVYQVYWPSSNHGAPQRKVLLRVYGEGVDVFFDRKDEIRTFEFMSRQGQGPQLLGFFHNGRVEEFINARTLSAADLREPEISALIAVKLKEFHDLDMPGQKDILIWRRLRSWLQSAKRLASPEEATEFFLDQLEDEISHLEMELELAGGDQKVGFCHNDLQYGNLMMDEETRLVTIIDYEYASYNPIAYDLANHFCEMAADYHTETPHVLDFTKYPDLEERRRFAQAYLSPAGEELGGVDLDRLLEDVEKYTLASHLLWGLWGIISKHVNDIDFDYGEYARQRFRQYWARKPALLGSQPRGSFQ
ncbi:unnamed protein product [Spirodela intermedia]|uniref:Uncharacterized protein n=1 Tax=Spirodela intermedia TaxID=51605 RepID=A0A7I8J8Y2_SPIIN|nr:unnamed protein product [Spirodela intermedia]CAA6666245.1 unnamed protein product [Spirodela intermedia]